MRVVFAPLLALVLLLAPQLARACAVCMSGREDDVANAFVATTVFMSVLPLGILGFAVWWVRRRLRELEAREAERAGALPAAAAGD